MPQSRITTALRNTFALAFAIAVHAGALLYLLNEPQALCTITAPVIAAHIVSDPALRPETIQPLPLNLAPPETSIDEPDLDVATAIVAPPTLRMTEQLRPHIDELLIASTGPRPDPQSPNRLPADQYPAAARRDGQQGTVALSLRILEDGAIDDVLIETSSGIAALDNAAARYARRHWHFLPGTRNGVPVADWKTVRVIFERAQIEIRY